MGMKTGHLVYGAVHLKPNEEALLLRRVKEVNEQFPESRININDFLDIALRIGIDMELNAIRKQMESGQVC